MKRIAFTLAEVLLTLTIIGVVAYMTIPALIAQTKNSEYTARLSKFYAEGSASLKQMAADVGCNGDLICTDIFKSTGDDEADKDRITNAIAKYFGATKKCTTDNEECFPMGKVYTNGTLSYFDPNDGTALNSILTNDGMSLLIYKNGDNCDIDHSASGTGPFANLCGSIVVDLNAFKGPNTEGYDQFWFSIVSTGTLYPEGSELEKKYWRDDNRCYQDSSQKDSYGCAARIIEEGWQINY